MNLSRIKDLLSAKLMTDQSDLTLECSRACSSDLMSDVLAFSRDKSILLTGLMNIQVIRTAEMMDIKAVIFVRGKVPTADIIKLANDMDIIVLCTNFALYETSGILYSNGLGRD